MSPDYAGDPVEVSDQPIDFDGTTIMSPTVGASADVAFFNAVGLQIGTVAPMVWNATRQRWVYVWDTTALAAGTYKTRVRVYDSLNRSTRSWATIRLSADPSFTG